jgi:hypothetical protein
VSQLIGVMATIYNFVHLPHAGMRSNDGEFASAVLHPWHSKADSHSLLQNARQASPLSSAAMRRHATRIVLDAAAAIAMTASWQIVGLSIADPIVRAKLVRISDGLMIAIAVSLPWSTSATGILLVLWLLALFPTLEWSDVRRELMTPAGGLPLLLVLIGVLGTTWADVPLLERWKGLEGFLKLLVIPLLMVQFRRSDKPTRVFIGFLLACVALLIAS